MNLAEHLQRSRQTQRGMGLLPIMSLFSLVLLVCCVAPAPVEDEPEETIIKEISRPRLPTTVHIGGGWKTNDIFVYSDSDKILRGYARLEEGTDSLTLELWEGDYIVAAVCNSPFVPDKEALERYETLETLSYRLEEENADERLASGTVNICAGESAMLEPELLSCCIILEEVNNNMEGYARLEDPRIWLEDVNEEAEIMRKTGFRQKETGICTEREELPCDVGMFTQYPGTCLYCFPNDAAQDSETVPRTTFVFEYDSGGETSQIRCKLPALVRGATVRLSLTVDSKESYEVKCR